MGVQVCSEVRESYGNWPLLIYPMWILVIKLKKVLGLVIGTFPEPSHWLVSGSLCIYCYMCMGFVGIGLAPEQNGQARMSLVLCFIKKEPGYV